MERRIKLSEQLHVSLIFAAALIALSPDLRKHMIIWIAVVLLWYILLPILHLGKKSIFIVPVFPILLFLWFFYMLFLELIGYSSTSLGNYFHTFAAFDMLLKTLYIKKYFSEKSKRFLYRVLQLTILAILLRNLSVGAAHYQVNIVAALEGLSDSENIASTTFYNMLPFMIGISFFALRYEKRVYLKALSLLLIALSYYFMLTINPRVIALFLSILLIYLDFASKGKHTLEWYLVWIVVTVLCTALLFVFWNQWIQLLPHRIQMRLNTVMLFLSRSDAGTGYGRITLMQTSIRTWLSSPKNFLIGVGYYVGMQYISLMGLGQHSLIADYLSWFGCVGGAFLLMFFWNVRKLLLSASTKKKTDMYPRLGQNIFLGFLMISITSQPISAEIFVSAFLMYVLAEPIISDPINI